IRGLSFAIIHSTTIALPAWREACTTHGLNVRLLPRDVATRWNSTYDMMKVAREYTAVVDEITGNKSLNLRKFELSDKQWDIVDDLLHIFKSATLLFSRDNISTIAQVIPMMDVIDDFFTETPTRMLHPAVKSALTLAQATLNKYYSRTDDSNVYRIAMSTSSLSLTISVLTPPVLTMFNVVLHPNFKLEYFRKRGWDQVWINTAEEILREEFKPYVDMDAPAPEDPKVCAHGVDIGYCYNLFILC
ncbi:hypothetical protein BT96DRAFT_826824, partial [Gymnopus androsaceus JB14]